MTTYISIALVVLAVALGIVLFFDFEQGLGSMKRFMASLSGRKGSGKIKKKGIPPVDFKGLVLFVVFAIGATVVVLHHAGVRGEQLRHIFFLASAVSACMLITIFIIVKLAVMSPQNGNSPRK